MAGATSVVSDNTGGLAHNRDPVGVSDLANKDATRTELLDLLDCSDDANLAVKNALSNGGTLDERFGRVLLDEGVRNKLTGVSSGLDGFGAGLNDKEVAIEVLCPFNIHRRRHTSALRVVLLDLLAPPGERKNILIVERELASAGSGGADVFRRHAGSTSKDHGLLLLSHLLAKDWAQLLVVEEWFVDQELIGADFSLHHVFSQSKGRVDKYGVGEACLSIDGEHDTRRTFIASGHKLDTNGQGHCCVVEAMRATVDNGTVGEEGGVAIATGLDELLLATDVEVCLLLTSKGRFGKILGRGGGAHGDGQVGLAASAAQLLVRRKDILLELFRAGIFGGMECICSCIRRMV